MKKTEILKVRVDAPTHDALMQYCRSIGQSPSDVLRKVLGELVKEEGASDVLVRSPVSSASDGLRAQYAQSIATMLISLAGHWRHECPRKQQEVSGLVEALFKAIWDGERGAPIGMSNEEPRGWTQCVIVHDPN